MYPVMMYIRSDTVVENVGSFMRCRLDAMFPFPLLLANAGAEY